MIKRVIFLISSLLLFLPLSHSQADGIQFFEGSFEEALKLASDQDKTIFVDAFTTWCGPCKRMKNNVFPDKSVGEFYNKHFINMAIDMETQAGRSFGMKYQVSGYPTLLFISQDGELVLKSVGGKNIERFIDLGQSAVNADDRSGHYNISYEEGNRDFDFMMKYIKSLNKIGKPSAMIAYDYLEGKYDISRDQKALFIYEAATSCDSKLFKMLTSKKYKNNVITQVGMKSYEDKIYELCWNTVEKGIEFRVEDLVEEAKDKYKNEVKHQYNVFSLNTDLAVAKSEYNASEYLKTAKKRIAYFDKSEEANEFVLDMIDIFPKDQNILSYALDFSEKSLKQEDSIDNNYTYGQILLKKFQYDEALLHFNKALEMASKGKKYNKARAISLHRKLALQGTKRNNK